jgi:hypothetical protein
MVKGLSRVSRVRGRFFSFSDSYTSECKEAPLHEFEIFDTGFMTERDLDGIKARKGTHLFNNRILSKNLSVEKSLKAHT